MALLKAKGILNQFLMLIGIIHTPLQLLYSDAAVFIGLVYDLLPFMILPLYANIEKLDHTLVDAARDLGASKTIIFFRVILPLTMPGIIAGIILVFLPAMTLFFVPVMLGGAKSLLLGNLIQNQFLTLNDWPMGAATSVCLLLIMGILLAIYWRYSKSGNRQELV
jgi:spermidine/putrescine transport system permease protein